MVFEKGIRNAVILQSPEECRDQRLQACHFPQVHPPQIRLCQHLGCRASYISLTPRLTEYAEHVTLIIDGQLTAMPFAAIELNETRQRKGQSIRDGAKPFPIGQ